MLLENICIKTLSICGGSN